MALMVFCGRPSSTCQASRPYCVRRVAGSSALAGAAARNAARATNLPEQVMVNARTGPYLCPVYKPETARKELHMSGRLAMRFAVAAAVVAAWAAPAAAQD